jgi:uncharacterized membrane protein
VSARAVAGKRRTPGWLPVGLTALVAIPGAGGVARLIELSGGPTNLPAKPHVTESPLPLILHIIAALTFAVLGAFQFSPGLRSRRPGWHRVSGRLVVALALVVALTALWLNQITPRPTSAAQLLYRFRLVAGSGMAIGTILGVARIRQGDIAGHRAWMIRAYALAFGAATHVFTIGIGEAIFGGGELTNALMQGAGWAINLAIAERAIRRRPRRRPAHAPAEAAFS